MNVGNKGRADSWLSLPSGSWRLGRDFLQQGKGLVRSVEPQHKALLAGACAGECSCWFEPLNCYLCTTALSQIVFLVSLTASVCWSGALYLLWRTWEWRRKCAHAHVSMHTHEEIRRSQQNKEESAAKSHSSEERLASWGSLIRGPFWVKYMF